MKAVIHACAADFLASAGARLERNEAANNLMLGLAGYLARGGSYGPATPLFATVTHGRGLSMAAIMTPPHKLVLAVLGRPSAAACDCLTAALRNGNWALPGVNGSAALSALFAQRWSAATGASHAAGSRLVAYALRKVRTQGPAEGRLRQAGPADVALVAQWTAAFSADIGVPCDTAKATETAAAHIKEGGVFLWEAGQPVSIADMRRPTAHGQAVSYVYTPLQLRGRGYCTACVSAPCRRILANGNDFVCLFADAANPVSNHVYQRIGFRKVAEFADYSFTPQPGG